MTSVPQQSEHQSLVYFVEIGAYIKIGFTTNLRSRLKSFLTSSPRVKLLLAIPGDRSLEKDLHRRLSDCRIDRELFSRDYRVTEFVSNFEYGGLGRALQFLDRTDPAKHAKRREEERERRVAAARQSKAEKDAYFASLVAERKRTLGW